MTTRSRRALYRVRNSAHRFVQAVDALNPADQKALGMLTQLHVGMATMEAERVAARLTALLGPDAPTLESFAKPRDPEDALMEAQDVGREMAEEVTS